MKLTQPRMHHGGRGMWRTPRRRAFNPSGVTLGANVTVLSMLGRSAGWQVWCKGTRPGPFWWVVNGRTYLEVHESDLIVTSQCGGDAPLIELAG